MSHGRPDRLGFITKECPRCGKQFEVQQAAHQLCPDCALQDEADSMEEWFDEA